MQQDNECKCHSKSNHIMKQLSQRTDSNLVEMLWKDLNNKTNIYSRHPKNKIYLR